jgi:peptidoglycan/LPS O-acetylase OafA/YrhL
MENRIAGYDLIRSFAIITVFLGHIFEKQPSGGAMRLAMCSLSPGLTMSLLGFISAALLSTRTGDFGPFLVRRLTRIYIPLWVCLALVLAIHAFLGKRVVCQHTLLHLMGLTALFELFIVDNKSSIGGGLWFLTAILAMYLLLPLLTTLFRHRNGLLHLAAAILAATALNFVMYGTFSTWNVVISFSLGVYLGVNGRLEPMLNSGVVIALLFAASVAAVAALATAEVIPYAIRGLLFPLYPLAFVPLFFHVAKLLPKPVAKAAAFFAGLSYEFYILHFYFINDNFRDFFSGSLSLPSQIAIGFGITLVLAYVLSAAASRLRQAADSYLLTGYNPA